MIKTDQPIQIFISAICGDEPEKQKYNIVRESLKVLIESTGFAKAYVFESEGASTVSAERHFTSAQKDCNVCIFIIDNCDGVSDGVQKDTCYFDGSKYHIVFFAHIKLQRNN